MERGVSLLWWNMLMLAMKFPGYRHGMTDEKESPVGTG
jgi:hypothetical protein